MRIPVFASIFEYLRIREEPGIPNIYEYSGMAELWILPIYSANSLGFLGWCLGFSLPRGVTLSGGHKPPTPPA